jgi:chemotaxis response regulator CheB
MVAHLATLLSLTSAQQASATTIFTTEENTAENVHANLMSAHKALQTAVEANDANGISSAAAQIGTLTAQQVQARASADAAFYALLTNDQKTRSKQLHPTHGFGTVVPPGAPPLPPPPPDQD